VHLAGSPLAGDAVAARISMGHVAFARMSLFKELQISDFADQG